jgi:hypothetical protein
MPFPILSQLPVARIMISVIVVLFVLLFVAAYGGFVYSRGLLAEQDFLVSETRGKIGSAICCCCTVSPFHRMYVKDSGDYGVVTFGTVKTLSKDEFEKAVVTAKSVRTDDIELGDRDSNTDS